MTEIKNMSNDELLEEYKMYDEMIHGDVCCYGKSDLYYLQELTREFDRRE